MGCHRAQGAKLGLFLAGGRYAGRQRQCCWRRGGAQIAALNETHFQPAPARIACGGGPGEARTDHQQIAIFRPFNVHTVLAFGDFVASGLEALA